MKSSRYQYVRPYWYCNYDKCPVYYHVIRSPDGAIGILNKGKEGSSVLFYHRECYEKHQKEVSDETKT